MAGVCGEGPACASPVWGPASVPLEEAAALSAVDDLLQAGVPNRPNATNSIQERRAMPKISRRSLAQPLSRDPSADHPADSLSCFSFGLLFQRKSAGTLPPPWVANPTHS